MATMLPPSNDVLSRDPFPASTKVYAEGSDPTIRVPFRAIQLTDGDDPHRRRHVGPVHRPRCRDRRARRDRAAPRAVDRAP